MLLVGKSATEADKSVPTYLPTYRVLGGNLVPNAIDSHIFYP